MVECAGLEIQYTVKRIQGSNPCLSANKSEPFHAKGSFFGQALHHAGHSPVRLSSRERFPANSRPFSRYSIRMRRDLTDDALRHLDLARRVQALELICKPGCRPQVAANLRCLGDSVQCHQLEPAPLIQSRQMSISCDRSTPMHLARFTDPTHDRESFPDTPA